MRVIAMEREEIRYVIYFKGRVNYISQLDEVYGEKKSRTIQTLAWVIGRKELLYTIKGKISGKTD